MAKVVLEDVVKVYDDVVAVNHVNLEIADGEFIILAGPSGCGKTTILKLIAGIADPTSGNVRIDDSAVSDLDPKDRDAALVLQNYEIEPGKAVWGNMALPLQMRKVPSAEITARINRAAEILGIQPLLSRLPRELSSDQRQRVAIGRAFVRQSRVILMDQPLSNLDAKQRVQIRSELKQLHQQFNATVIYATHDQLDATTMADRIAIMKDGVILQFGPPELILQKPANMFVAGFIGSPAMNFLPGKVVSVAGRAYIQSPDGWRFTLNAENSAKALKSSSKEVVIGIRHDQIKLSNRDGITTIKATVYAVEPTGDIAYVYVRLGEGLIVVSVEPGYPTVVGEDIWIDFDQSNMHIFDANTQLALSAFRSVASLTDPLDRPNIDLLSN